MTDPRDDPRYIRMIGLTLLSALLVVASCQVEQPPTGIPEVEEPSPTTDVGQGAIQADPIPTEPSPAAAEPEPEVVDDVRAAIEALRENPVDDLPPPPTNDGSTDLSAAPVFTPMTVRPEIRNRNEVQEALMRLYPPTLRDAGIGGRVVVWFFISEEGRVLDRRVSESSGRTQLDEAALEVADVFRFSPALNREQIVQVWIQLPITFQVEN